MPSNPRPPVQQFDQRPQRGGTALAVVALTFAVIALGLSAWAVLRPAKPASAAQFTSAEQADAKATTCAAADVVRRGVSLNTNLQSPGGAGDVTGSQAIAANARLALSNGGQYLLARLPPATPPELAASITRLADTLLDLGAAATAGALNTDPDQAARLASADAENATLTGLCR